RSGSCAADRRRWLLAALALLDRLPQLVEHLGRLLAQPLDIPVREREQPHVALRDHRGVPLALRQNAHLAEEVARAEVRDVLAVAAGETIGVLFPIVDPLGNLPTFLALTARQRAETRRTVIRTVVVAGAVLLIAFAAVGEPVLNYFGISREGLQIAGGIIVAFTGFQMITGTEQKLEAAAEGTSIALSPLVVPLLAGPGAMAA